MFGPQLHNFTLVAQEAIPAAYLIVVASGSSAVQKGGWLPNGGSDALAGVAQQEAAAGDHVTCCPFGLSRVMAGEAIAENALITANGSGRAIAAGSGDVVVGYAWQASLNDGDIITAWIAANQIALLG